METFFNEILPQAVTGRSPLVYVLVFSGGLLTSLSPCILSMIPVMMGYIGGYGEASRARGMLLSATFVLGLAVTFAVLGVAAAAFGKVFGQIGRGWYYLMAAVAIVMGLHLLGVFRFNLPGLKSMPARAGGLGGAFLVGLFFGLVASPCATPVLAVIMIYVAGQGDLAYGGSLLFAYGLGHGLPLLVVGTFTAALKGLVAFRRFSQYITYGSGTVLIGVGLYILAWVTW
ncbi:hypothetical protein SY88_15150 [Clostridiales bacterium PH28_bin88]|nr:hypothetical protein SY88_15150 [Clostridiales bacterium PH28_bin88]